MTWVEAPNGLTAAEKVEVVRAHFPAETADIARSAQVAVLRELLGADDPNFPPTSAADLVMSFINKLRELEAGVGQTATERES